jgi:hypothetical protein
LAERTDDRRFVAAVRPGKDTDGVDQSGATIEYGFSATADSHAVALRIPGKNSVRNRRSDPLPTNLKLNTIL